MRPFTEQVTRRFYQTLTLAGACLSVIVLLLMTLNGSFDQAWQIYQRTHGRLKGDSASVDPGIRQIVLPRLHRVDRCVSCHLGVEDSSLALATPPFTKHQTEILANHDLAMFGCTVCHRGDGRDPSVQSVCNPEDAFNDSEGSLRYIGASCFRCHGTLFGPPSVAGSTQHTDTGRALIRALGCLGCHKLRGLGGVLGPDLSSQGSWGRAHYRFRNVRGEQTIPNWLREHFQDPGRISPGSSMFSYNLGGDSLEAMIAVLLGLHDPDLPLEYYATATIQEYKGERALLEGRSVYAVFCSGCHGPDGQGRPYDTGPFGAPRLAGPEFQSIASREMISFVVSSGRGLRPMPAWQPSLSGISERELDAVVDAVRSWKADPPPWELVENQAGRSVRGVEIYRQECALCHGDDGAGGIGPALKNPSFLSVATDRFLYQTIVTGRRNTAMPSWSSLEARAIADLLAYFRTWPRSSSRPVRTTSESGDVGAGGLVFASVCSRCHGVYGEGGIGPAILNPDFLDAASDRFIVSTLERGREHSPMFALSPGSSAGPADVLAFMRSRRDSIPDIIPPGLSLGQPKRGQQLYGEYCRECHGRNGEGTKAPALNNQEFLSAAPNGYLLATITLGRSGTPMPAWGRETESRRALSTSERQDLVAYIRIWQTTTLRRP